MISTLLNIKTICLYTHKHRDTQKELQQHIKGEYLIRIIALFHCALTKYL